MAKDRSGAVEALRVLRTTRKTAMKCRRAALQQLHNTIVAAPEEMRDPVRNLTRMQRLRTCAAWRPDTVGYRDPVVATKLSLKYLARRVLDLNDEIAELDRFIGPLVEELAPNLLQLEGVGIENAGELMVAAGENLDRLRSEASFAMMCGTCPIRASSGQTQRHRLNRGGNRQANSALHMVVICRMRTDQRTKGQDIPHGRHPIYRIGRRLYVHRLSPTAGLGTTALNCPLKRGNSMSLIAQRTDRVDHWRNSDQKQRWVATALLDIEPRLNRIQGCRHLPVLRAAIRSTLGLRADSDEREVA